MEKNKLSFLYKGKTISRKKGWKTSAVKTAAIVALGITFTYPALKQTVLDKTAYYEVELNGEVIGAVSLDTDVWSALKETRHELTKDAGTLVYLEPELVLTEKNKLFGERLTQEKLKESMYDVLQNIAEYPRQSAYAVKVSDNILYLSSEEEVLELLNGVKNRIDSEGAFMIELAEDEGHTFRSLAANVMKSERAVNDTAMVFATEEGGESVEETTEAGHEDGIIFVEFEQDVQVTEADVPKSQITSVSEALEFLTKDNEKAQTYEVVQGDCMSVIAEKNEMSLSKLYELNAGISEDTVLQIGQELIVEIPEPELTVLAGAEITYEEPYQAETIYIDNDSWFTNEEVVQQEGSVGYHEITAVVNTRNGKEIGREIVSERVVTESLPTIIERGTQTPPTYIWPLYGGSITSYFGQRWGRLHGGVDVGVSTGTTVMASASGRVVSAGWNGSYGYCVLLQHPDGRQTRYAHLSKVLVSAGESVTQGQKIALSGNTGRSTGPHLHFEMIIDGERVNPLNYMD